MRLRLQMVLLLGGIAAATAASLRAAEGDTLITDPQVLERLGFAADARDVYLAKGVVLGRSNLAPPTVVDGSTGTPTTIHGNQHHPRRPSVYDSIDGRGDISLVSGDIFYDAQFQLPHGSVLRAVQWYGRDNLPAEGEDMLYFLISYCQPLGGGAGIPTATVHASADSSAIPGEFTLLISAGNVTIDSHSCAYIARTRFEVASGDLRLRRVKAYWDLQVSPSPPFATFPNDVPTSHPFFRFIEALARAGITAGCAPSSFCPDDPVTRGEMAVFLAAALGLAWP